jgi:hypothetical protein
VTALAGFDGLRAVLAAAAAVQEDRPVDLATVRALVTAEADQFEALAAETGNRGAAQLTGVLRGVLPAVDHLEVGDIEAAKDVIYRSITNKERQS